MFLSEAESSPLFIFAEREPFQTTEIACLKRLQAELAERVMQLAMLHYIACDYSRRRCHWLVVRLPGAI